MGFRRWIIYSCCALAAVLLLAHAFIPHIHHDGHICFVTKHLNESDGQEQDNGHDHTPLEDCKLHDLQLRPEVNESITPDLADRFLLNFHLVLLPAEGISVVDIPLTKQRHKPCLLLYTSVLAGSSLGLRAPPVPAIA